MVEESSQIESSNEVNKVFHTQGFIRWGFGTNIMITVVASMSIMFVFMSVGVHAVVSTIAFLGTIFGVIKLLSGATKYTLTNKGILQEITPNYKKPKPIVRNFNWDEIKSYVRGSDVNRSQQPYNYLHIDVKKDPGTLRLSDDKSDKQALQNFADAFEAFIQKSSSNSDIKPTESIAQTTLTPPQSLKGIVKKKTFYEKPIAKIITILFIVLCGFLIDFGIRHGMQEFNWYRLLAVVVPGTIYMVYRVFYNKR